MKYPTVLSICLAGFLLSAGSALPLSAAPEPEVEIGESIHAVIAKLGEPEGQFQQGRSLIFYYSRGMVDFTDGHVVRSTLVSSDEARQIRQTRERLEADQRRQAEAEKNRLTLEGATELTKRLEDKTFAAQPAEARLTAWQEFSRHYPYTDITGPLDGAQAEVDQLQRHQQTQKEIQRINQRLTEIKARFHQLDKDYAASLANWKRNEITAERNRLNAELAELDNRLLTLKPASKP
jgi:hypothetical protein